ncbi:MAG: TIR domain-containing protein [Nostocales cyanobacterium W4_Combined_metabat2_030]|nr:TIR domain-containing protein [Nostocales cyanobacterium W4_Combined_metabat2_030]
MTLYFARDDIFKDVDSISLGIDFRKSISEAVQSCDVILAVIGKNWLHSKDKQGNFRLSNPDDFVRIELEAGLERNIPVIPVLVSGADMPEMEELPISLQPLVYRNAVLLRPDPDFSVDIQRLIRALTQILKRENIAKRMLISFKSLVLKSKLLQRVIIYTEIAKRMLISFKSAVLKPELQRRFIIYTVITAMLFSVLIGGYWGYLKFFSNGQSGDLDECNRPNPPARCLFKKL